MLFKLKRYIASNKYFWKYRHLIQKNIFSHNYGNVPYEHFDKIFKNLKFSSVLDYGCATGDKFQYFVNFGTNNVYGIDINKNALDTTRKKLIKLNVNFTLSNNLSIEKINLFLSKNRLRKFDLVIVDRLFYILNNRDFYSSLDLIVSKTNYLYIDDFFLEDDQARYILRKNVGGYLHSNYDNILKKRNFGIVFKHNSPYRSVHDANAMSALYNYKS